MPNTKRKPVPQGDDAADDDQFLLVLDYIKTVEWERMTKLDWAALHQIDRTTVYQWIIKWTEAGLLRKARQYMGRVMFEDVIVTNRRAVQKWDSLLEEQVRLAKESKSDFVRFQAIGWLYSEIVKPLMEQEEEPGSAERDYITLITQSPKALNPLSVGEAPEDELELEALNPRAEST